MPTAFPPYLTDAESCSSRAKREPCDMTKRHPLSFLDKPTRAQEYESTWPLLGRRSQPFSSFLHATYRASPTPRCIWVDSICIDQGNTPQALDERGKEVMMGEIYQKDGSGQCSSTV